MGRHRKYKNPVPVYLVLEKETLDEFDRLRGKISRGEFIDILIMRGGDTAQIVAENRALKREITELRELLRKRDQYIEELESKLRIRKEQGPKHKVSDKVLNTIEKLFANTSEVKLANLMRALGYKEEGDALIKRAEKFIFDYFSEDRGVFISEDLGLIVEPVEGFSILASKIKRLEQ